LIRHPNLVGRDSVEPGMSSKFSVSSLKRQPGLNLETWDSRPAREDTHPPPRRPESAVVAFPDPAVDSGDRDAGRDPEQDQRANGGTGRIREIARLTERGGELEHQEQGTDRGSRPDGGGKPPEPTGPFCCTRDGTDSKGSEKSSAGAQGCAAGRTRPECRGVWCSTDRTDDAVFPKFGSSLSRRRLPRRGTTGRASFCIVRVHEAAVRTLLHEDQAVAR